MTNPLIDSKDKSQAFQGEGRYLVIWADDIFEYRDDLPYTPLTEMKWNEKDGFTELVSPQLIFGICTIIDFKTGLYGYVKGYGLKRSFVRWLRAAHDEKGNPHYAQVMWVAAQYSPKRVQE